MLREFALVVALALVLATAKQVAAKAKATGLGKYEIWRRETGLWWGNYTFLDGVGVPIQPSPFNPRTGLGFPYRYDQYVGFINLTIVGDKFYQHNYFLYPPAPASFCNSTLPPNTTNVIGGGVCGVNGYERPYEAFGNRYKKTNCMVGTRGSGSFGTFTTYTVPLDETSLVYTTITTVANKSTIFARQLNTVPDEAGMLRYRSQQGFSLVDRRIQNLSHYRELKVGSTQEWVDLIKRFRQAYNIRTADQVQGGNLPMTAACLGPSPCPTNAEFTAAGKFFGEKIPGAMKQCRQ